MRRRLRRAAAGLGVLAVLSLGLLAGEGLYARSRSYLPADSAPAVPAAVGPPGAPVLRVAVLGDSTAAGVGASSFVTGTVTGRLASSLSGPPDRLVQPVPLGVAGARSADLAGQLDRLDAAGGADLAVVLIGANDATHVTGLDDVRRDLGAAVTRLRAAGVPVVVGTCPDMGAARALPQPLRALVGWRGRAVGRASQEAVRDAGGVAVDLAARTGPAFRADPATLSVDLFHPSDRGYGLWADALLADVVAAAPVGARLP